MQLYVEIEIIEDFLKGLKDIELEEALREIKIQCQKELDDDFIEPPSDDLSRGAEFLNSLSAEDLNILNTIVEIAVLEIQNQLEDSSVELVKIDKCSFSDSILVFQLDSRPIDNEDDEEESEELSDEEEEEEDDTDD